MQILRTKFTVNFSGSTTCNCLQIVGYVPHIKESSQCGFISFGKIEKDGILTHRSAGFCH